MVLLSLLFPVVQFLDSVRGFGAGDWLCGVVWRFVSGVNFVSLFHNQRFPWMVGIGGPVGWFNSKIRLDGLVG